MIGDKAWSLNSFGAMYFSFESKFDFSALLKSNSKNVGYSVIVSKDFATEFFKTSVPMGLRTSNNS